MRLTLSLQMRIPSLSKRLKTIELETDERNSTLNHKVFLLKNKRGNQMLTYLITL